MNLFGIYTETGETLLPGYYAAITESEDICYQIIKNNDGLYSVSPFHASEFPTECTEEHPPTPVIIHHYEDYSEPEKLSDTKLWFNWDTGVWWYKPFTANECKITGSGIFKASMSDYCDHVLSDAEAIQFFKENLNDKRAWVIYWKEKIHTKIKALNDELTNASVNAVQDSLSQALKNLSAFETNVVKSNFAQKLPVYSWIVRNNGVLERLTTKEVPNAL